MPPAIPEGGAKKASGRTKHDRILTDDDNDDDKNTFDDMVEWKKPNQKKARQAPAKPTVGGGGDSSAALGYAEEQHENATADLDSIIKLKTMLEMEYAKALYTAFDPERKLEIVKATAIGSTPLSAAPFSKPYF